MVYLIDLGTCYKIGITNNLKKRVESFKNSRELVNPIDIIVYPQNTIEIETVDKNIESELHSLCEKYKITRELFQRTQEVVQIFQDYKINKVKDLKDWTEQIQNIIECSKKENKDKKNIYQYDLCGNLIKKWNGITQIERELGFDSRGIYKNLQGIFHKSHGFIWSLHELSDDEVKEKVKLASKYNCNKIFQYSKNNILINQFNSLTEASQATGISISSISLCCQGKYKTAGKYIWKRED